VKGWKITFQANRVQKKSRVAILISDKTDFKPKLVSSDKKKKKPHYISIKETIHQEDTMIINVYAPNIGASSLIKQTLLDIKRLIGPDIRVCVFNTTLSSIGRWSRLKINRETSELTEFNSYL
jgi:hypothetical protein